MADVAEYFYENMENITGINYKNNETMTFKQSGF